MTMISKYEYKTNREDYENWKEVSLLNWYKPYESILKLIFKPEQIKNVNDNRQIYLKKEFKIVQIQYLIKHYASDKKITQRQNDQKSGTTGDNMRMRYEGLSDLCPILLAIGIENLIEEAKENNLELPLAIDQVYKDDAKQKKFEDGTFLSVFIIEDLISVGIEILYEETKSNGDIPIKFEEMHKTSFEKYL